MIKAILNLNHDYQNNLMKYNYPWNQICSSGVNNDNVRQHLDTIHWNQNVYSSMWRLKGKWQKKWVYSCKTWNLTSFMINAKASRTTLWEVVFSSPWAQRKRCIPKGCSQMQCDKPRVKRWKDSIKCTMQWKKHLKPIRKKIHLANK
jgi:hypothetical protein